MLTFPDLIQSIPFKNMAMKIPPVRVEYKKRIIISVERRLLDNINPHNSVIFLKQRSGALFLVQSRALTVRVGRK